MDATYIQEAINQLKTNIKNQLRHRTLLKYTSEPVLDEHQLFYLLLPYFNGETCDDYSHMSATTIGMVHASLSEHDKIHEENAISKEQQLTVLSGDFYSGRYYQLLATTGDILLIRKISEGIANRCEQQVKVYEQNKLTLSQWIENLLVIESELINQYYFFYHFEKYSYIMKKSLLALRLKRELWNYQNGIVTSFIQMITQSLDDDVPFDQYIGQEIHSLLVTIDQYLQTTTLFQDEVKLYIMQQLAMVR
nr:heptaprenyl diphosphate synthase component 1 [Lysinibacillus timonensis]